MEFAGVPGWQSPVDPHQRWRGSLLPPPKRVILGAVQQSQHLHLHQYCFDTRTTTNSSRGRWFAFCVANPGDQRCRVDGWEALGDLAECNEPLA